MDFTEEELHFAHSRFAGLAYMMEARRTFRPVRFGISGLRDREKSPTRLSWGFFVCAGGDGEWSGWRHARAVYASRGGVRFVWKMRSCHEVSSESNEVCVHRVYARRTACRHRDHRRVDRDLVARITESPLGGAGGRVPVERPSDGDGGEHPLDREQVRRLHADLRLRQRQHCAPLAQVHQELQGRPLPGDVERHPRHRQPRHRVGQQPIRLQPHPQGHHRHLQLRRLTGRRHQLRDLGLVPLQHPQSRRAVLQQHEHPGTVAAAA